MISVGEGESKNANCILALLAAFHFMISMNLMLKLIEVCKHLVKSSVNLEICYQFSENRVQHSFLRHAFFNVSRVLCLRVLFGQEKQTF